MNQLYSFDANGALERMSVPLYLYRFLRDDEHLESTLSAPYAWFSDLRSLNDPMESANRISVQPASEDFRWGLNTYPRGGEHPTEQGWNSFGAMLQRPGDLDALLEDIDHQTHLAFERKLDQVSVCSFSETPSQPLMWAHYADSHRGVCMVVETARFLRDGAFGLQAVDYVDDVHRWNWPSERRKYGATD